MNRFLSLLVAALVAAASLHVAARLVLADTPFGGPLGLLTLYGETAAIAVGLAALRSRVFEARDAIQLRPVRIMVPETPKVVAVTPNAFMIVR